MLGIIAFGDIGAWVYSILCDALDRIDLSAFSVAYFIYTIQFILTEVDSAIRIQSPSRGFPPFTLLVQKEESVYGQLNTCCKNFSVSSVKNKLFAVLQRNPPLYIKGSFF